MSDKGKNFWFPSWDGTPLNACHWTDVAGQRNPIVLVHGLGEHSGRYDSLATTLVAAGYSVYCLDWRGHGQSPGRRGDAPGLHYWVEDIAAFLEWVAQRHASDPRPDASQRIFHDTSPCVPLVIAHSLGGAIALQVAHRYPQLMAKLYLISPYFRPAFEPQWWRLAAARWLHRWWPSLTLNVGLSWEQLAQDREVQLAIKNDPLSHQKLSARLALQVLQAGERLLVDDHRLAVRCRIVHGDADEVNSPSASRQFAAKHPGTVEFIPIPEGAHQIHNDRQTRDQVVSFLIEFVSSPT